MIVPSMHERDPYEITMQRIPVVANQEMVAIASAFYTLHQCGDKQFNMIRSKYADDREDSKLVNVCKHEVAAQLSVIERVFKETGEYTPLQNSMVPLLSKRFALGAARALDSLLIRDRSVKSGVRRPHAGELEAAYWLMVHELEAKNALYSSIRRDGPIKEYDWTMRRD